MICLFSLFITKRDRPAAVLVKAFDGVNHVPVKSVSPHFSIGQHIKAGAKLKRHGFIDRAIFDAVTQAGNHRPVVVQVLEGENAIAKYRDVMGATDPAKAAAGTVRKTLGLSVGENSVHGSDGPETAAQEIAQFFAADEIVG